MNTFRMSRHRRASLIAGAIVLTAVAVLAVWLLRSNGGAPPLPADAGPAAAAPPEATAPVVPRSTLDPVLAIAPPQDRGAGVRGVVLLPDGRPAAVATVLLYRQVSAWPEWRGEEIATATTGPSGRFEFAVERAPNLLVGFAHQDYAGGLVEAPASLPELVLRLERGFDLQGIVVNDGGVPLPNVRVALESSMFDERFARATETNAAGQFRFDRVAMGVVRLVARHEWWQPAVLNNVVVGADRRRLELRFQRPALALEGRVLALASQEPVVGAEVLALPPGHDLGRNDPTVATSQSDGRFRLPGLAPGILRLLVRHPEFGTAQRTVVVGPTPPPLAIDLPPRASVHGRLVAADPKLVRGAHLTLRSFADELVTTTVGDDGAFAFDRTVTTGAAALSVAGGRFAFQSGTNVQQVRVDESGNALEFEVVPPAVVTGRVVDDAGAPITGVRLTATRAELLLQRLSRAGSALLDVNFTKFGDQLTRTAGGEPEPLLAVTGADGRFRIAGLAPGAVDLRAVCPGYGAQRVPLEVPATGEERGGYEVVLPRGCGIDGVVSRGGRPLPGAQVGVVVDGMAISAVTGLDGRYRLQDLPPGTYKVRARYSTFPTQLGPPSTEVAPETPARVDLEFPPGRVVRGVVRGRDAQPVEGAMVLVRGEQGDPVYTDSAGAFDLEAPQRAVELQVGLADRSALQIVSVPMTRDSVEVAIDVPPLCTIVGTVLCLPGRRPAAGVLLRIARGDGDEGRVESRWLELQAGQLRNPLFPAGRSRVTFWCEGQAPLVRDVDLQAGDEYSFGELLLEPGAVLRGVVVDADDRPVIGAEVFLGEEADLLVFQAQTRTDEDGAFAVRGVASAASTLLVRAAGYAWTAQPLRLPEDVLGRSPLRVRLERGSTISVKVAAADASGAMLVLRRSGRILATSEIGDDGIALFPNRGPGDYVVQRFGDERQQVTVHVEGSGRTIQVEL